MPQSYLYNLLESLGQQAKFRQVRLSIKSKIFLLDYTTISLCLSLFDWVKYKTANTITELYRSRWQIEIFFREINQLLHIKSFIGTSANAVVIQIWTALITILNLKALRAMAKFGWYLSNLVAFIRLNLFVKVNLIGWLDHPFDEHPPPRLEQVQEVLF